eukprot:m.152355 g.152355  ORF g.152355 m.152355 type:complete len:372 (+) comp17437_c1_seq2:647-1762(+)
MQAPTCCFSSTKVTCLLVVDVEAYQAQPDITKPSEHFDKHVWYWLESLEARVGGDVSVVLVLTKVCQCTDEVLSAISTELVERMNQGEKRRRDALRKRIDALESQSLSGADRKLVANLAYRRQHRPDLPKQVADVVLIDSANMRGYGAVPVSDPPVDTTAVQLNGGTTFSTLTSALVKASTLADADLISGTYRQLDQVLQAAARQNPVVSWTQLTVLVKDKLGADVLGRRPRALGAAIDILHRLGSVRWFKHNRALANVVFLDMAWLGDALRRVVRHDKYNVKFDTGVESGLDEEDFNEELNTRLAERGRLNPALLPHLWHELNLRTDHFHALYMLLFEAGICFPLNTSGKDLAVAPLLTEANVATAMFRS